MPIHREAAQVIHSQALKAQVEDYDKTKKDLPFSTISLHAGVLKLNGKPVPKAHFEGNRVHWHHEDHHGTARIMSHGMAVHGVVDSPALGITNFAAMLDSVYTTQYKEQDGKMKEWFKVKMGFKMGKSGDFIPHGELLNPKSNKPFSSKNYNFTIHESSQKKNGLTYLTAKVEIKDTKKRIFGFNSATLDFATDYSSISGSLIPYDGTKDDLKGKPMDLTGKFDHMEAHEETEDAAARELNIPEIKAKITVIQGKGLAAKDRNWRGKHTTSDPYVKVYLQDTKIGKTQVIGKDLNPKWNQVFETSLQAAGPSPFFVLKIFDKDMLSSDDCMGVIRVPIDLSMPDSTQWYEVPGDSANNAKGCIQVRIELNGNTSLRYEDDEETQSVRSMMMLSRDISSPNEDLVKARALSNKLKLSVTKLYDIPAPALEKVHEASFALIRNLMLLAVANSEETVQFDNGDSMKVKDWLPWFGSQAPSYGDGQTVSTAQYELIKDEEINKFLIHDFAKGYLIQSMSKSNDNNIKESLKKVTNLDQRLAYFWRGEAKTCFAQSPGYQKATSKVADSVYAQHMGRELDDYILNNPAQWAEKLYDHCMEPQVVNGLAMNATHDGRRQITHLCNLLHILDPKVRLENPKTKKQVGYGTALYSKVMDIQLQQVFNKMRITKENKDDAAKFLKTFYKGLFDDLVKGGGKWSEKIDAAVTKEVNKYTEEWDGEKESDKIDEIGALVVEALEFMTEIKDVLTVQCSALGAKWMQFKEDNPKKYKFIKFLGPALQGGLYIYSATSIVMNFMNWDKLKPEAKAELVMQTLDTSANILNHGAQYLAAKRIAQGEEGLDALDDLDVLDEATAEMSYTSETDSLILDIAEGEDAPNYGSISNLSDELGPELDTMETMESPSLVNAGREAAEDLKAVEGDIEASVSKWKMFGRIAEGATRMLGAAAMAASCVVMGFQTARDFAEGQPTVIKVFDILEIVTNGIGFFVDFTIGAMVLAGVEVAESVVSFLPVVGAVIAAVGLLIGFVMLFLHRNPPETPEEKFMRITAVEWLNAKPEPPQEWLDDQKKLEDHLAGKDSSVKKP